jgi:hypothetical protein
MITYPDGSEARSGDYVAIDSGARTGMVEAVIDTIEELEIWNLEERGLMVKSDYYGLVFLRADLLASDEVKLISRSSAI